MKEKKAPLRKCALCGGQKTKAELIRVVRTPEGEVLLDKSGRLNGRGVYMCHSASCLKKAVKSGRLATALSCAIPDSVYEELANEVTHGEK